MNSLHNLLMTELDKENWEIPWKSNVYMKDYTSFKIGGPVSLMLFPKNLDHLYRINSLLYENKIEPLILGRGTNLLVDDNPLDLVVINTTVFNNMKCLESETEIIADSGVGLNALAMFACELGLTGLEFAHGIPGTLGGAIKMNAGAFNCEIKDIVRKTTFITPGGELLDVSDERHEFGYRHSRFSDTGDVIQTAKLKLQKADKAQVKAKMDELSEKRRNTQPLDMPSAGSVFKRPVRGYAAELIDKAGLKGYTVGGAQISKRHAGFIVNLGNASFADVIAVMEHTKEEVLKLFNVELEPEVKIIRNAEL